MRLVGYIKSQKSGSFATPIYSGKEREFFFHTLDQFYNIIGFKSVLIDNITFKKLYLSKNFDLGSKGAIVFIGKEGYIKYDAAKDAIGEIINYIKDCYQLNSSKNLLEEAFSIQKKVTKEVKNKTVKSKSIFLAFDLPLLKKEVVIQEKNSTYKKLEQISDPAFKNEINRLNALEKNYELMLKMRSNERRSNLKTYNYQFHFSQKAKLD